MSRVGGREDERRLRESEGGGTIKGGRWFEARRAKSKGESSGALAEGERGNRGNLMGVLKVKLGFRNFFFSLGALTNGGALRNLVCTL